MVYDPSGFSNQLASLDLNPQNPKELFTQINSVAYDATAFVTNDKKYVIVCNLRDYHLASYVLRADMHGNSVALNGKGIVQAGVSFPSSTSKFIILLISQGSTEIGLKKFLDDWAKLGQKIG